VPQRRLLIGQYEDVEAQREERAIDQERDVPEQPKRK
jgi:hypothetical protein